MSQPGPILLVSKAGRPAFADALHAAGLFPLIETDWSEASRAVADVQPVAVLAAMTGATDADLAVVANRVAARTPYLPLFAIGLEGAVAANAIPFMQSDAKPERLLARLRAALRVRTLHATVLRRLLDEKSPVLESDPIDDATVLLMGRGGCYPALSVSLGERMSVVGALSMEAAGKHLNNLAIDGIVLGDGFAPRVVDAFLTVLSEDARFRNLPVVLTSNDLAPTYDLPNLEIVLGAPHRIAANAMPLIRQHAFEARLTRTLRAIDAGGLLDPLTGLLTPAAFARDFETAVTQALSDGGGLSVARFAFDPANPRAQRDGARIISHLMRKMDFGALHADGSAIVVFTETDLRDAHAIARRLASVIRQTSHGKGARNEPAVNVAAMSAADTPDALLARLRDDGRRAAS
jgi:GGDEF domain-containing protein